jgi:hypothetical protein
LLVFLQRDSNFKVALKTRKLNLSAILAFYEINDVILRKRKICKSQIEGKRGTAKRSKFVFESNHDITRLSRAGRSCNSSNGKNNKAYCLQVEDTEPKETLKKQR